MSLKLWLIRHGQSSINTGQWSNNPAAATLTDLGKEQARTAAGLVEERPDLIISSPLIRAKDSTQFLLERWKTTPNTIWPIEEFIYLSPKTMQSLAQEERKKLIDSYWQKNDPLFCHGKETESFAAFLKRIEHFHHRIKGLKKGFVVVVGHGQFFKAYHMGLKQGFDCNAELMRQYREEETRQPIENSAILKIDFGAQGDVINERM